ncbi:hypothetical protein, partial [Streptomyces noursei]|uniref:hypothetical protein n=1 Tax=Streptomyces noursei TaxID=1971 RepID=UPI00340B63B7
MNGSSANTSASRSRTRIAKLPFGNAARATTAVCSGTSGSPAGRIDTRPTSTAARQDNDPQPIIADPPPPPQQIGQQS